MRRVLFICSQDRLRREQVFSTYPGLACASAGLNNDAENQAAPELLEWADSNFVMEKAHRHKLSSRFKSHVRNARAVCLDLFTDVVTLSVQDALSDLEYLFHPRYLRTGLET
jgi:predicted protein tyrosine phosphatase